MLYHRSWLGGITRTTNSSLGTFTWLPRNRSSNCRLCTSILQSHKGILAKYIASVDLRNSAKDVLTQGRLILGTSGSLRHSSRAGISSLEQLHSLSTPGTAERYKTHHCLSRRMIGQCGLIEQKSNNSAQSLRFGCLQMRVDRRMSQPRRTGYFLRLLPVQTGGAGRCRACIGSVQDVTFTALTKSNVLKSSFLEGAGEN